MEGTASCDRNVFSDCIELRALEDNQQMMSKADQAVSPSHVQAHGFLAEIRPELIPDDVFLVVIGVRDVREEPMELLSPGERLVKGMRAIRGAYGKGLRCKLVKDRDAPTDGQKGNKPVGGGEA